MAAFQDGLRLMRGGDLTTAAARYTACIADDPDNAEAHRHLGLIRAKQGDVPAAIALLEQAVALAPTHAEAQANLSMLLRHVGRSREAVSAAQASTQQRPGNAQAHHQFGLALMQRGDLPGATVAFALATTLDPAFAAAHLIQAEALRRLGRTAEALAACEQGLALEPASVEGLNARGQLRESAGDLAGALEDFRAALSGSPQDTIVQANIANIHLRMHRPDLAREAAEASLALDPGYAAALGMRGTALLQQGLIREAIESFSYAIDRDPHTAQHYANLGALLVSVEQTDAAIDACRIGVALAPTDPEGHFNLAIALRQKGLTAEAIEAYRQAHAHGSVEALVDVCHLRQQICDWEGLAAEQHTAGQSTYRRGRRVAPFSTLTATDDAGEQRACAEVMAVAFPRGDAPLTRYDAPCREPGGRLRVGYLSCDFYQHATASLVVEMLEGHDRERFDIRGYSYGPADDSALRRRVTGAFERFVELRESSHIEAARRIAADGVDILIDLKGYTQGARTEILAYRPAPIQVNYLGYPGTMGAPFIDYIVADRFVAPFAHAAQFSEKIVQLPDCYQPNDALRPVAAVADRAALGLPAGAFVFCCFNNSYKITPEVFGIWARLLQAVPGSVLWLLETSEAAAGNLRREAAARGVAPDRLVFAPRIRAEAHIARMALADLFLDTLPVNAHTTASEALWAGLPVLTCAGESFVARVAGSLLQAVGLPELVTTALADYEALALALAREPQRLAALRQRLGESRATAPLFDGRRHVRGFEAALRHMQRLRAAGRPPEAFAVSDLAS